MPLRARVCKVLDHLSGASVKVVQVSTQHTPSVMKEGTPKVDMATAVRYGSPGNV